jgi:MFS superfamily sulfate permease-like transporter
VRAVVIDANGVVDMDLSALAVIDDLVAEVGKQHVQVFFAGAHERVVKALDSYDLLQEVGGQEMVVLNVEDVYHGVLDSLQLQPLGQALAKDHKASSLDNMEGGIPSVLELARQRSNRSRSNSLSHAEEGKDERTTTRLETHV